MSNPHRRKDKWAGGDDIHGMYRDKHDQLCTAYKLSIRNFVATDEKVKEQKEGHYGVYLAENPKEEARLTQNAEEHAKLEDAFALTKQDAIEDHDRKSRNVNSEYSSALRQAKSMASRTDDDLKDVSEKLAEIKKAHVSARLAANQAKDNLYKVQCDIEQRLEGLSNNLDDTIRSHARAHEKLIVKNERERETIINELKSSARSVAEDRVGHLVSTRDFYYENMNMQFSHLADFVKKYRDTCPGVHVPPIPPPAVSYETSLQASSSAHGVNAMMCDGYLAPPSPTPSNIGSLQPLSMDGICLLPPTTCVCQSRVLFATTTCLACASHVVRDTEICIINHSKTTGGLGGVDQRIYPIGTPYAQCPDCRRFRVRYATVSAGRGMS